MSFCRTSEAPVPADEASPRGCSGLDFHSPSQGLLCAALLPGCGRQGQALSEFVSLSSAGCLGSGSSGVHSTRACLTGNSCHKRQHSNTQRDHSCSKKHLMKIIDHLPGTAKCHRVKPSSAWSKESVQTD